MALDHGMLNLPLDKRGHGSLDTQIDRWKKQDAKERRQRDHAMAAKWRALRTESKQLHAAHETALLDRYQSRFGRKELKATLLDMSRNRPETFIKLVKKFMFDREGA